jgi:hypothetical protein
MNKPEEIWDEAFRLGVGYERSRVPDKKILLDKDCCLETYTEAYRAGKADENKRTIELLKSKRCKCLDLEGDELIELINSEDDKLKHMNCEWVFLDWTIALVEGEQK